MNRRITLRGLGFFCALGVTGVAPGLILESPSDVPNGSFEPCITIGDITGDGISDFIAGVPNAGDQTHLAAYSGADGSEIYQTAGPAGHFLFGEDMVAMGDHGGLSTPDFAVTSGTGSSSDGVIFILEGATGDVLETIPAPGDDSSFSFGESLFRADLTGTSTPDLITGSPYAGTNDGRIYIYDGASLTLAHTIDAPSAEASQAFGLYSIIPDLNNDGVPEIGAAARYRDVSAVTSAGEAYIFSGADRTLFRTINLTTPQQDDQLTGPYPLGDLNGDNKSEYSIAYGTDGTRATMVIYSGVDGSELDTLASPDIWATDWGRYVVGIDDLTGDTVNEILVGTRSSGDDNDGTVYVYNGATRALITSFGQASGGEFGRNIQLIGDYDGDGKDDVAIPARYQGYGKIYLFTHEGRPWFLNESFNLAEIRLGLTPTEKTTNVYNFGFTDLEISSISISGTDAGDFSLTTDPTGGTVAVGDSASIGLTSAATVKGFKSGVLTAVGTSGAEDSIDLAMEVYERPTGPEDQLAYLASEDRVLLVDITTGERDIITGAGVGVGPEIGPYTNKPYDVLILDDDTLLLSVEYFLMTVDVATGDRTLLNSTPLDFGISETFAIQAMEWEAGGTIIAFVGAGYGDAAIARITLNDPPTAELLSYYDFDSIDDVGSGPGFTAYGSDMLLEAGGDSVLIADFGGQKVFRVDLATGDRTVLNSITMPNCTAISSLSSTEVALGSFGTFGTVIIRYDLQADTSSLIADSMSYTYSASFNAINTLDDGNLIAYDGNSQALIHVDVDTGDINVIASYSTGLGPDIPYGNYSDPAGLRLLSDQPNQVETSAGDAWRQYQ